MFLQLNTRRSSLLEIRGHSVKQGQKTRTYIYMYVCMYTHSEEKSSSSEKPTELKRPKETGDLFPISKSLPCKSSLIGMADNKLSLPLTLVLVQLGEFT